MKTTQLVVAAAQMKFRAATVDNVSWITEAIHSSAKAGADVILFPECAVTGYNRDFAAVSPSEVEAALLRIHWKAMPAACRRQLRHASILRP